MGTYTLSSCFFNAKDKKYTANVLFKFVQDGFKVALDSGGRIAEIYRKIASNDQEIATWLSLMSNSPSSFEHVQVSTDKDTKELEFFLLVCSATANEKKLVVFSYQTLNDYGEIANGIINYGNKSIYVLDKDKIYKELNESKSQNIFCISNSIIATDNSKIKDIRL